MKPMRAVLATTVLVTSLAFSASPPALINYQGVLRNASNAPLSGTYDMVLRFFSAAVGGDEILVDRHTAADGTNVTVSAGLFNVQLGAGAIVDGSGPGSYTSLSNVFRDYGAVYLSVQVGAETLVPRTRMVSAAYAANANNLDGRGASSFLDTSSTAQTKLGPMSFNSNVALTGSGVLTVNGNVGIGTAAPDAQLMLSNSGNNDLLFKLQDRRTEVSGDFLNKQGFFDYDLTGEAAYIGLRHNMYFGPDPRTLVFGLSGVERMRIKNNGKVGIGTTDPSARLHVVEGAGTAIIGQGTSAGGYFADSDSSGYAYAGYDNYGIMASGSTAGGQFNSSQGVAVSAIGSTGILASGFDVGGTFSSQLAPVSAKLAVFNGGIPIGVMGSSPVGTGVRGEGGETGGYFVDLTSGTHAFVGSGGEKIEGNGAMAFVQNHPLEKDRVIVYQAPEGDEVATYTRGTARLADGVAHVKLGQTFEWVTNPDIGLTAYLTPVGQWSDLYVESKSPTEIVVRSRDPQTTDVTFDYIVYGLRIGFEEMSVVQEKTIESLIPSMKSHRERYAAHPELRAFNALERFKTMRSRSGDISELQMSASKALHDAIGEYDPAVYGPVENLLGYGLAPPTKAIKPEAQGPSAVSSPVPGPAAVIVPTQARFESGTKESIGLRPLVPDLPSREVPVLMAVGDSVEAGDVLVADPGKDGSLRKALMAADPAVVGIALGGAIEDQAPVAVSGVALCKVDAGFGAIKPGDLLTVSSTPGHAMRAAEALPGTILGKALGRLDAGTGLIKVLVTVR